MQKCISLLLPRWVNPHVHTREEDLVEPLTEASLRGGVDVLGPMPNTKKGLRLAYEVLKYGVQVLRGASPRQLTIISIALLNEQTAIEQIEEWFRWGIRDCKVYPLGKTTHSHLGVRHYHRILPQVKRCGELGIKVHLHPEHPAINLRDAEYAFLGICDMFLNDTEAVLVWEHGSDGRCVSYWEHMAQTGRFYITLTPQHLLTFEDEVFGDAAAVCKTPIRTQHDRDDLRRLVARDYSCVMAGDDSAFHPIKAKHPATGCCACGAFQAPFSLQLYAQALDPLLTLGASENGLAIFTKFISENARRLHDLPHSSGLVRLTKKKFRIPKRYRVGSYVAQPFWGGKTIDWTLTV